MSSFREYTWDKFCESAFPNLRQTSLFDEPKPMVAGTIQPIVGLDFDHISQIIHLISPEKATEIMQNLGFSGRKGVTKTNLTKFKNILISQVRNNPELVSALFRANNPNDYKPLLDYWRHFVPKMPKNSKDDIGLTNIGLEPQIQQQAPEEPRSNIDDRGVMEKFPPVGSRLEDRLYWAMQNEREDRKNLASEIVRIMFLHFGYKPKNIVRVSERGQELLGHYMMHGARNLDSKDQAQAKQYRSLWAQNLFSDIANYSKTMGGDMMASLIDALAGERIVRLTADELQWLGQKWVYNWSAGNHHPTLDPETSQQMVRKFNNQKYWGESNVQTGNSGL